jgi:hypothetical protein
MMNALKRRLSAMPAVIVTGARQTGKSTLVKELNAWIRRRLRVVQWNQWPTCKSRYKGLRKPGIREPELHMLACCGRGPWPVSNYSL